MNDSTSNLSSTASWWRNVLIGSLKFPPWYPISESLTFQQAMKLNHSNPVSYLLVVKTLNPLEVAGVIFTEDMEKLKLANNISDETMNLPVGKVETLVRPDFAMLAIQNNAIGNVEDCLKETAKAVVLFRTTRELKLKEDATDEGNIVERIHPIAVVSERDVKSWIASVEEHHNIV